ncbi:MAG: helix-turn-helix transcriptional regulator [Micropruina sp.]|uniref:helix-turn-helix transcriptional regulator n=1 Tax=Micropruina sp. TaxID=2737536 RepID=UPI0039E728A5
MKGIGAQLVREGRKRRGITQAQLAALAGTTQSAIARLESGGTAPSLDDVIRYLRLMDLDLDLMLVERDESDWSLTFPLLELTPEQRLAHHDSVVRGFEELRAARVTA